ncbi:low molecular weight protein-tyrosine-phosphatase [Microbacterium endophyticum]|nr:low molecular weight phosphotyrosine protein phosphatase [Microbacterium endophyticum]
MADVVFRRLVAEAGLTGRATSTSAGTGDWHVGEQADHRAIAALSHEGYDGSQHRARQFTPADFERNDLIVALDRTHERILRGWARSEADADKIALLLSFGGGDGDQLDVPDPYYAGPEMFDDVLAMIESACRALFRQLHPAIRAV